MVKTKANANVTQWSDKTPSDLNGFRPGHPAEAELASDALASGKFHVIRPKDGVGAGDLGFIPKDGGGPVKFAEVHVPTGRGRQKAAGGQITDAGMQNVVNSIDTPGRAAGVSSLGTERIDDTSVPGIKNALGL